MALTPLFETQFFDALRGVKKVLKTRFFVHGTLFFAK